MDKVILAETSANPGNDAQQQALMQCLAMEGPALNAIIRSSDLKILVVNKQFEHYLGYANTDFERGDIFFPELFEPYLYDRFAYQLDSVKDNKTASSRYVIYLLTGRNGEQRPYYLYASPVYTNSGDELFYLTMHPDLSKWDMPFTSFNTRELFLEQFNSEDFGTFEWILSVDKVFWSVGVYHIYEIDDKNFEINKPFADAFTHPSDRERVLAAVNFAKENDTDLNVEYKIITAKKQTKIIHALGRFIKNSMGRQVKLAGSIRDVTIQRHIEGDLKNKVEELNHSNKELEEFAYIASHDMQEPLRKITTFSDRLSEKYKDILTGDGLMYLSRMVASADNMRSLINDLLEFSRISKTGQTFEQVNLSQVLKQVKTDLELTIEETGTVLHSHILPLVDAIPSQMKQLFTNIIGNAIKFHKQGVAPVITIETNVLTDTEAAGYDLPKNATYYKISITDNGIGFEDEYSARIFQVFQRLHGKSEYPGSGIGLAICKKIVEHHHGIIYAENIPDTGARFVFILPQHQQINKERNI